MNLRPERAPLFPRREHPTVVRRVEGLLAHLKPACWGPHAIVDVDVLFDRCRIKLSGYDIGHNPASVMVASGLCSIEITCPGLAPMETLVFLASGKRNRLVLEDPWEEVTAPTPKQ